MHGLVVGALFLLIFASIAEIFFWDEFATRFSGIALYYLMFPREVIGNLEESFNISLYMPMVLAGSAIIWFLLRHRIGDALVPVEKPLRRRNFALVAVAAIVGLSAVKIAPSGVSENREINELAHNGWDTFMHAALTNDQEYDGVYPTIDNKETIRLAREMVRQDNTQFLDPASEPSLRRYVDNGDNPKKLNIVIVTNESFGSKFVSSLDNKSRHLGAPLTPALDRLMKDSLTFTNVYASGQRTVRGLEATETAFAPIPGISTARRAQSKDMYSLPYLLKSFGYDTAVLYGGMSEFDNMGNFWSGIGYDHVWDQSDIRHESFSTIWGVSDEDLYTEALQRMDEETANGQPFMLTMMTVSNHRPYKFPQDHIQYDGRLPNRENTARYADWAYGDFIERARKHAWFDNTVFVFVADHSEKVNGAAQVPLQEMRIPMFFYAPKHIAPRKVDTLAAQIDLIPTLMGTLGFSYVNPFFGKDILRVPQGEGWISAAHNYSIAFGVPGHAVTLEPTGEVKGYKFEPGLKKLRPETADPEVTRRGIAITQLAHHMFYSGNYHVGPDHAWPTRDQVARSDQAVTSP